MHKREMRHIQKILDRSWPAGIIVIGTAMHLMKRYVVPLYERRYVFFRIAKRDPYPIVLLLRLVHFHPRFSRRHLVWMSGETHALPFFVIRPAMICTPQRLSFDLTQREPCATVQAEIAPGMDRVANTPQYDILVQQANSHRRTLFEIWSVRHYMPIIE